MPHLSDKLRTLGHSNRLLSPPWPGALLLRSDGDGHPSSRDSDTHSCRADPDTDTHAHANPGGAYADTERRTSSDLEFATARLGIQQQDHQRGWRRGGPSIQLLRRRAQRQRLARRNARDYHRRGHGTLLTLEHRDRKRPIVLGEERLPRITRINRRDA